MKLLSLLLVLISFSALADQTCLTTTYEFRITKHFIEANDGEDQIRIPYSDVRSVSRVNGRNNFEYIIQRLSENEGSESALSKEEIERIDRFSMILADGSEELIGKMLYIKGFDKTGLLIVRYMILDQSHFRCH